jgi:hypothetical protein
MAMLNPDSLARASEMIHQAAEEHWRRHGTAPIKVVLFTADGVAELVDFEQGIGQQAAAEAIGVHAARIGAVAVAMTAISHIADVVVGLPNPASTPGPVPALPAGAQVVGEVIRAVVTLTVWPDRNITQALRSDIHTGPDGADALAPKVASGLRDLPETAGLTSWLTGLLPSGTPGATS